MGKYPLETIRHSAAHVMAAAVQELYPNVKFDIGPATEDGFYYDFDLEARLTVDDLPSESLWFWEGRLKGASSWGHKESHTTERLI